MKPLALFKLRIGTLLILGAPLVPVYEHANAGDKQKSELQFKKPKTKHMQKSIYNYGSTLVRFNGKRLEWSKDSGRNWREMTNNWLPYGVRETSDVYEILQYGNEIVAFTNKGIFYSVDGCKNWKFVISGWGNEVNVYNLQVVGKEIITISNRGVYYTTDRGLNWRFRQSKW